MSVLYISYDGLMEPLGQSQIFPYLKILAVGRPIALITFEKGHDLDNHSRRARFNEVTRDAGIRWIPLRYHKKPPILATVFDLLIGLLVGAYVCLRYRVQIVHSRGYVPSVLALMLKRTLGPRFIFDTRGFWIDARVEAGLIRKGSLVYRVARWYESRFLQRADVVFALTEAAVATMKTWPAVDGRSIWFEVVTTCTDLNLFKPAIPDRRADTDRPLTLGYVGNAGFGYLFDPVLDLYLAVASVEPNARLTIVNRNDHALIRTRLRSRGIDNDHVDLIACDYSEVPEQMSRMDAGLFFYRWSPEHPPPVFTRMGEFLGCGIPCISNVKGLGEVEILETEGVGVVVGTFDRRSLEHAAERVISLLRTADLSERCVRAAARHFSLTAGVEVYEGVYRRLEGRARSLRSQRT